MSDHSPAPVPPMGFWDELTTQERNALRAAGRQRVYSAGSPLVRQGDESDHVVIITSGWVKVSTLTENGHEVILAVRGPGDLVGESSALGHRQLTATVTALGSVQGLVLAANRFAAFLDAHPRTWRLFSGTFIQRLENAERRAQEQSAADGQRRLALLLIYLSELSEQYHPPGPDGSIDIVPKLTQYELASWVDTARETVARALKIWRDQGLIRTGRRKIMILDRPGLSAYAHGNGLRHSTDRP